MTSRDYIEATAREVEEWPGTAFRIEHAGKHLVAILRFGRRERKVFFAKSPSDNGHGLKNHIGIVRQELRAMGATKRQAVTTPTRQRERNRPTRAPLLTIERAPVMPDPFEALAQLKETKMRSITIEGVTLNIETFQELPPHPVNGRPRSKGPVRLACEALRDGESVKLPTTAKKVASANLHSIGKALGAKFASRTEKDGVRIFRVPTAKQNVAPIKQVSGWA